MKKLLSWFRKTSNHISGPICRAAAGAPLFFFGWMKFLNAATQTNFLATLKLAAIPMPGTAMWVAAGVEVSAGALLLTGFAGRLGGMMATMQMLVALYVHLTVDFGNAPAGGPPHWLPVMVLLGAVAVTIQGSGRFSLDHYLGQDSPES